MFAQRRNRLTTHLSERIPVVKRRISTPLQIHRHSGQYEELPISEYRNNNLVLAIKSCLFVSQVFRTAMPINAYFSLASQDITLSYLADNSDKDKLLSEHTVQKRLEQTYCEHVAIGNVYTSPKHL
jgi:hypothetical protein